MHAHRSRPMARPIARPPQARRIGNGPAVRRTPAGHPAPGTASSSRPRISSVAVRPHLGVSEGLRRDAPRLAVAGLSAIVPGLGQLVNGRRRLALVFMVPTLVLAAVALAIVQGTPRMRLLASLIAPSTLDTLLALNVALFAWRLAAVGQAFLDRRPRARPSSWGIAGLLALGLLVAVPHAAANFYGTAARNAFGMFFESTTPTGSVSGGAAAPTQAPGPGPNDRLTVLLVGVDKTTTRTEDLTDTMIVASIDPVLGTASMVSVPRDMIGIPLGDGRNFGPKLNSLMSYAGRHPSDFPKGGMRTLEDAVGTLLGVHIDYYVMTDFYGFVKMIDDVGGVDVVVQHGFNDPMYDAWNGSTSAWGTGWSVTAGPHHFDGLNALAFARSRYAPGESDFTRAARQQQILVAFKQKLMSGGDLLFQLPDLLKTLGDTVHTDLPPERLPGLAALADTLDMSKIVHAVIEAPFVRGAMKAPYGSVQVPNLPAIRELGAHMFPPVGTASTLWAPGQPTALPSASASPTTSAAAP